jgi:hypothetical protein
MDKHTQMFFGLVMQYQQLGMMSLGKIARPEGGTSVNLEEAAVFIDMLECVQVKTKGNLGQDEQRFIETTLADLRLNFVEEKAKAGKKESPDAVEGGEAGA